MLSLTVMTKLEPVQAVAKMKEFKEYADRVEARKEIVAEAHPEATR